MFSVEDTIVAIATPPGRGGLGVVRLSGDRAHEIAGVLLGRTRRLPPRRATLARVLGGDGRGAAEPPRQLDEVVVTYFPGPRSYTGEDVVEVSAHGSPVVLGTIVHAALGAGARLARPGEFTLRAYLRGRLDLVQAEAVRDLIDAVTPEQARAAFGQLGGSLTAAIRKLDDRLFDLVARLEASLDFPEEGYHFVESSALEDGLSAVEGELATLIEQGASGRVLREGRSVAFLGRTNVGKSSIFNNLVGSDRAIVTSRPGTTRDVICERVVLDGVPVTLIDTAGFRAGRGVAEVEGMHRARQVAAEADLVLVVLDHGRPLLSGDLDLVGEIPAPRRQVVRSKIDLPAAWQPDRLGEAGRESVGVTTRRTGGVAALRSAIVSRLGQPAEPADPPVVTNLRHVQLLERARAGVQAARRAAGEGLSEEFVLADLQESRVALEEITGRRAADAVLERIFEQFCIGK